MNFVRNLFESPNKRKEKSQNKSSTVSTSRTRLKEQMPQIHHPSQQPATRGSSSRMKTYAQYHNEPVLRSRSNTPGSHSYHLMNQPKSQTDNPDQGLTQKSSINQVKGNQGANFKQGSSTRQVPLDEVPLAGHATTVMDHKESTSQYYARNSQGLQENRTYATDGTQLSALSYDRPYGTVSENWQNENVKGRKYLELTETGQTVDQGLTQKSSVNQMKGNQGANFKQGSSTRQVRSAEVQIVGHATEVMDHNRPTSQYYARNSQGLQETQINCNKPYETVSESLQNERTKGKKCLELTKPGSCSNLQPTNKTTYYSTTYPKTRHQNEFNAPARCQPTNATQLANRLKDFEDDKKHQRCETAHEWSSQQPYTNEPKTHDTEMILSRGNFQIPESKKHHDVATSVICNMQIESETNKYEQKLNSLGEQKITEKSFAVPDDRHFQSGEIDQCTQNRKMDAQVTVAGSWDYSGQKNTIVDAYSNYNSTEQNQSQLVSRNQESSYFPSSNTSTLEEQSTTQHLRTEERSYFPSSNSSKLEEQSTTLHPRTEERSYFPSSNSSKLEEQSNTHHRRTEERSYFPTSNSSTLEEQSTTHHPRTEERLNSRPNSNQNKYDIQPNSLLLDPDVRVDKNNRYTNQEHLDANKYDHRYNAATNSTISLQQNSTNVALSHSKRDDEPREGYSETTSIPTMHQERSKASSGVSVSNHPVQSSEAERDKKINELDSLDKSIKELRIEIENYGDGKGHTRYYYLDDQVLKLMYKVDDVKLDRNCPLRARKLQLTKDLDELDDLLKTKA